MWTNIRVAWAIFVDDVHLSVVGPRRLAIECFTAAAHDVHMVVESDLKCKFSPQKGGITATSAKTADIVVRRLSYLPTCEGTTLTARNRTREGTATITRRDRRDQRGRPQAFCVKNSLDNLGIDYAAGKYRSAARPTLRRERRNKVRKRIWKLDVLARAVGKKAHKIYLQGHRPESAASSSPRRPYA